MNKKEKRIVRELAHPLYTVEYLEEWLKRSEKKITNIPTALQAMAAKGYYEAIKSQVELTYKEISHEHQILKDLELGNAVVMRINDLCENRKITSHELRKRTGLARQTMYCIIEGTTQCPNIVAIGKIAQGFSISVREFFDCDLFGPKFGPNENEGGIDYVSKNSEFN